MPPCRHARVSPSRAAPAYRMGNRLRRRLRGRIVFLGRSPLHGNLTRPKSKRAFFRASRKHIVNLSWVEGIEPWFNGGLMVRLRGGDKVEVSRRQAAKFKDMMSL